MPVSLAIFDLYSFLRRPAWGGSSQGEANLRRFHAPQVPHLRCSDLLWGSLQRSIGYTVARRAGNCARPPACWRFGALVLAQRGAGARFAANMGFPEKTHLFALAVRERFCKKSQNREVKT